MLDQEEEEEEEDEETIKRKKEEEAARKAEEEEARRKAEELPPEMPPPPPTPQSEVEVPVRTYIGLFHFVISSKCTKWKKSMSPVWFLHHTYKCLENQNNNWIFISKQ